MNEDTRLTVRMSVIIIVSILAALLLMTSCAGTKYVTVPEYHYRDSVRTVYQRDSIHQKDSIFMFSKGDTVFHEHYNTMYKEFYHRDTLCVQTKDSIKVPYPVQVTKTVNKLHWWQKVLAWLGAIFIGVIGFNIFMFIKKKSI